MSWKKNEGMLDLKVVQVAANETLAFYFDQDYFKHPVTGVQHLAACTCDGATFAIEADEVLLYRLKSIRQNFPLLIKVGNIGVSAQNPIWSVSYHLPDEMDSDQPADIDVGKYATQLKTIADADSTVSATNIKVASL